MAGKRTFKPQDWMTSDSDGWATQREFSRREMGERYPRESLYMPRWLFWLIHGWGAVKIGLALFVLWAIGHGGIPVVSDVVSAVGGWLWSLVVDALTEVWGYVWTALCGVGSWLVSVLVPAIVIAGLTALYGLVAFTVWRWLGWEFRMHGVGSRLYTVFAIGLALIVAVSVGVLS